MEPRPDRCPDCAATLRASGNHLVCPSCGLRTDHPLAARVWQIDVAIWQLTTERHAAIERMRRDRSAGVAVEPAPVPRPPVGTKLPLPPSRPSTTPPHAPASASSLSVQQLLVGLGTTLLLVAAVVFAAVMWRRIGAAGQAAVLLGATFGAGALAVVLRKRSLTTTAEGLAVVTGGLALVDVHALRLALFTGRDAELVWAIGLAAVAAVMAWFASGSRLRAPKVLAFAAAQVPALLLTHRGTAGVTPMVAVLAATALADWYAAASLASRDRWFEPLASWCAGGLWLAAAVALTPSLVLTGEPSITSLAAGVWVAAVPFGALLLAQRDDRRVWLAGSGAVMGLLTVLGVTETLAAGWVIPLTTACVGGVLVLLLDLAAGPPEQPVVRAVRGVAIWWATLALLPFAYVWAAGLLACARTLEHAWTHGAGVTTAEVFKSPRALEQGPALVALLPGAAIGLQRRRRRDRDMVAAIALGALTIAGALVGTTTAVPVAALVGTGLLVGFVALFGAARSPGARAVVWALFGVWWCASALLWSAASPWLTVGALLVTAGTAAGFVPLLVVGRRSEPATVALAVAWLAGVGCAAAWPAAAGMSVEATLFAILGTTFVASGTSWWFVRRTQTDTSARLLASVNDGFALGLTLLTLVLFAALGNADALSAALALTAVVALAHSLSPARRWPGLTLAATTGTALLWLRLALGQVHLVEAYTLAPAFLLVLAGWALRRRRPQTTSWEAYGAALALGLLPSLAVALSERTAPRALVLLTVASALAVLGAQRRLKAPLASGVAVAATVAVDQLGPTVAALPRWLVLAVVGSALLFCGATFERRRSELSDVYDRYRALQ